MGKEVTCTLKHEAYLACGFNTAVQILDCKLSACCAALLSQSHYSFQRI